MEDYMDRKLVKLLALPLIFASLFGCSSNKDNASSETGKSETVSETTSAGESSSAEDSKEPVSSIVEESSVSSVTDEISSSSSEEETGTQLVYNFSTLTETGVEMTGSVLEVFQGLNDSALLTDVTATKVYNGNGTGGAYEKTAGLLKFGTGSANGELAMTFDVTASIVKVDLLCHDWYTKSEQYPTNSNTVSVNGSEAVLAPYNESGTFEVLSFDLSGTNTVTITSVKRIFLKEIVVYLAD